MVRCLCSAPSLSRKAECSVDRQGRYGCHFLEDGRHITFYNDWTGPSQGGVECFDIHTGRRVWTWTKLGPHIERATFHFRPKRSEAVVSLVHGLDGHNDIIILEADFRTGESRELLHLPIDIAFPPRVRVCGDFFGLEMDDWGDGGPFLLVNWRTAQFILFNSSHQASGFAWIPGHIILACPGPKSKSLTTNNLRIYSLASLDHLWRPVSEFTPGNCTDPTGINCLAIKVPGTM
ncbi:hypothetical protein B0H17DRAFT_127534 [Mycena rosella]|uniref:Uncharacterized protein n=1 Tax=Mycena rosella TaxID=1033263 RepID=A0AAD7D2R2_MYCRO|nr:hypothetical protein B0H17DRAFT_127534 [Mycena rosella]